jgi:transposase
MTLCPNGSPERGALLRKEKLYHSHIEYWRKQQGQKTLPSPTGKKSRPDADEELACLRAENRALKAEGEKLSTQNDRLSGELERTKSAPEIVGKAFALLQDISSSADSKKK